MSFPSPSFSNSDRYNPIHSALSFWSLLGPLTPLVWSLLSDIDVIHVCHGNHAAMKEYGSYTLKRVGLDQLLRIPSIIRISRKLLAATNNDSINNLASYKPELISKTELYSLNNTKQHQSIHPLPRITTLDIWYEKFNGKLMQRALVVLSSLQLTSLVEMRFVADGRSLIDFSSPFIPRTVRHIYCYFTPNPQNEEANFKHLLSTDVFPSSLLTLVLPKMHNFRIHPHLLPASLRTLKLGNYQYEIPPAGGLPSSITELEILQYKFPLGHILPPSLLMLTTSGWSITPKDFTYTPSIQSLTFADFEIDLLHHLPASLTHLCYNGFKKKRLFDVTFQLPMSLTRIDMPYLNFTGATITRLHSSLKSIKYSPISPLAKNSFSCSSFPPLSALTELVLLGEISEIPPGVLPPSLQRFSLRPSPDDHIDPLDPVNLLPFLSTPLAPGSLPHSLTQLDLPLYYDFPIPPGILPPLLTKLQLPVDFDQQLQPHALPPSLTQLTIQQSFNQHLEVDSLPLNLTTLLFQCEDKISRCRYNKSFLPRLLPSTLTRLDMSDCDQFNHPFEIGVLPASLIFLSVGEAFNHSFIPSSLPPNLRSLTLGAEFNSPLLPHSLPLKLTTLTFGGSSKFNQPIGLETLPPSLLHLQFGFVSSTYMQPFIPFVLPPNLLELSFSANYSFSNDSPSLPLHFPPRLEKLVLSSPYISPFIPNITLPSSLTSLTFSGIYRHPLVKGTLPASLCYLDLRKGGDIGNRLLPLCLPVGLLRLKLNYHGYYYEQKRKAREEKNRGDERTDAKEKLTGESAEGKEGGNLQQQKEKRDTTQIAIDSSRSEEVSLNDEKFHDLLQDLKSMKSSATLPTLAIVLKTSQNPLVLDQICKALQALSDYPKLIQKSQIASLYQSGILPPLIQLLRHPSPTVREAALVALRGLVAEGDEQLEIVISAGILHPLSTFLQPDTAKRMKKHACRIISNIMRGSSTQIQAVMETNIIHLLISILHHETDQNILREVLWAINNCTIRSTIQQIATLHNAKVISALCTSLNSASPTKSIVLVLKSLENILRTGKARQYMDLEANFQRWSQGSDVEIDLNIAEYDYNPYIHAAIDCNLEGKLDLDALKHRNNIELRDKCIALLCECWIRVAAEKDRSIERMKEKAERSKFYSYSIDSQGQRFLFETRAEKDAYSRYASKLSPYQSL